MNRKQKYARIWAVYQKSALESANFVNSESCQVLVSSFIHAVTVSPVYILKAVAKVL